MPTKAGIQAFERLLVSGCEQGIVVYGKENRISKYLFNEPPRRQNENLLAIDQVALQEKGTKKLVEIISDILKLKQDRIETEVEFGEYGFDSISLTRFSNALNDYYELDLRPTLFYNYPTIRDLIAFLSKEYAEYLIKRHGVSSLLKDKVVGPINQRNKIKIKSKPEETSLKYSSATEPIAIIGMSGRFPGSPDLDTFWENLKVNKDLITEVPAERWDWRKYYGDPEKDKSKTKVKWGGFIEGVDEFDPLFFGISPKEAELMDPQHRLTLETVYHALEDAGINIKAFAGSDTGVFIGSYFNDYATLIERSHLPSEAQMATGLSQSVLANRISYLFDLHGPSEPVDTACSSSLVAIHRGVEHIRNGSCGMVIAGGVSLNLLPEPLLTLSQAGMLSEDGRCKTFDQSANGYVRGEGVGVVILKALSRAEADGNPIYGIIRGTAENHGGKANTLTSPNPQAQKEVLLKAYRSAGIDPRDVDYIEAHGTGTPLGDPIETEGLKLAFEEIYKERNLPKVEKPYCGIGSVKTNIGHLEAAAGMAGVMKILLCLKHHTLVGNPQLKRPNEHLQLEHTPFYLQKETKEWTVQKGKARIAGVSSFGFGGVNSHVIIEEYQPSEKAPYSSTAPAIILLSANNGDRLKEQAIQLKDYLITQAKSNLFDIAYTLQIGRVSMEERLVFLPKDKEELKTKLQDYLEGESEDLFQGNIKKNRAYFLLEGEAGQAYIQKAIDAKESKSLAQLWVKGVDIDWNLLYPESKPQKISLPSYPFEKKRYWLPAEEVQETTKSSVKLHPLLHQNISDLNEQKFNSIFSGTESFLADHQIKGEKVLPGVAYLELAREAGWQSTHQKIIQVKEVSWLSPIRVNEKSQEVGIRLYPLEDGLAFEIYTRQEKEEIHCQGKLGSGLQSISQSTTIVEDLPAIQKRFDRSIERKACYQTFQKQGIAYGPSFKGIEKLFYNSQEALSKIVLSKEAAYTLNPGLLDSALQTCLGFSLDKKGRGLALPFRLGEVNIYSELPETIWCHARKSSRHQVDGAGLVYDLDLFSEGGELLLSMRDFVILPLEQPLKNKGLEKATVHLYSNDWIEYSLKKAVKQKIDGEEEIVLLNSPALLADRLKTALGIEVNTISNSDAESLFILLFEQLKEKVRQKTAYHLTVVCREEDYLNYGFVTGLFTTANLELPKLQGKLIVLDNIFLDNLEEIKSILESERTATGEEVRYRLGKREVKQLNALSIPAVAKKGSIGIKAGGVYWISGGAGGLGLLFARHIAETKDTQVILSGRSTLDKVMQNKISALNNVTYLPCDVSDRQAVQDLFQKIKTDFGKLDGIIHSAGVLRDSLLVNKKTEEIQEVLAPKIKGSQNIDEVTQAEAMDFMVLFSSLTAITGNVGQADYAAANAYMDHYATFRNQEVAKGKGHGHTLSINWPLWEEGGMQIGVESRQLLEKRWEMQPLPTQEGIHAFEYLLNSLCAQGVVTYGKESMLDKHFLNQAIEKRSEAGTASAALKAVVTKQVLRLTSEILKIDFSTLETDTELGDYGFDSILLTKFANQLNTFYDLDLLPTVFYNYPTIAALAEFLSEQYPEVMKKQHGKVQESEEIVQMENSVSIRPMERARFLTLGKESNLPPSTLPASQPIAIVGMSGRFPGSPDLATFWKNLKANKDLITEVPVERWDWKSYYGDGQKEANKTKAKWGGFIEGIDQFDPLFFGLSPREAELMDPQQRLALETTYAALEDAGISPDRLKGTNTGVFIGVSSSDYAQLIGKEENFQSQAWAATGMAHSVLTNRISYLLDIHGPSEPIDTACSSSLVAIHRAVENIRLGNCALAIAGGVNALLSVENTLSFSQAGMLSEDGRCRTFDQSANGYVRGEGVGMVILKALGQAEADGNPIYGLIRGTAENHGGKANTLTSPNPQAQKEVLLKAYRSAGINPRDVGFIEAHGTGTPLGDPIETEGLKLAFKELYKERGLQESKRPYCSLSSVKANIGHLEAAAGVAGVIKTLFSLKYHTKVGNPQLKKANSYLKLENSPFYLQRETQEWGTKDNKPRIAGVSSFGFGGVNAHLVIEEYPGKVNKSYTSDAPAIVLLSAKDVKPLKEQAEQLKNYVRSHPASNLYAIAYTLQTGRATMEERLAMVVKDKEELSKKLQAYLEGKTEGFFQGNIKKNKADFLLEGEAGKGYIDIAIKNKESESLAQLWVKGVDIDWKLLYPENTPQKISLPTYPFERKRYWFDQQNKKGQGQMVNRPYSHKYHSSLSLNPVLISTHDGLIEEKKVEEKKLTLQDVQGLDSVVASSHQKFFPKKESIKPHTEEEVFQNLSELLSDVLYLPKEQIDAEEKFVDMGLDSIIGVELIKKLNHTFSVELPATDLYNYPTLGDLSDFVFKRLPDVDLESGKEENDLLNKQIEVIKNQEFSKKAVGISTPAKIKDKTSYGMPKKQQNALDSTIKTLSSSSDIAVIGLSAKMPGVADVDAFWENLKAGRSTVIEIPESRWAQNAYFDPRPNAKAKSYCKWMGVLEGIDQFDSLFFNISPKEAELMDPQQRLFLQESWKALEDAAYAPASLSDQKCGVFIGVNAGDYNSENKELDAYSLTGGSSSILSARISYLLNLKGPCMSIDTACSSALVALAQACDSLVMGNSEVALVGGVNVLTTPKLHIMASQAGMLSPDGKSHTFDEKANGFVPAEGVGVVLLKSLAQAEKDNDRIYGVIKGWGVNQDGATNGITAPSDQSQTALEKEVYKKFNINPETISYVETHGTGTKLGDPIEVKALKEAFQPYTKKTNYCALGSVKTNIGHALAAAGIAGLIKVLKSLQHKQIPPSLHFDTLNEHIKLDQSPFYVNTKLKNWETEGNIPRKAAISSFGFSGTNAHVVIEEYQPKAKGAYTSTAPAMILLSAKNSDRL